MNADLALTSADLQAFIDRLHLPVEIWHLPVPTPTVEAAARAVSVRAGPTSPAQIVKSILFLVESRPVLAITSGTGRIDPRPIARLFDVGRRQVCLAPPETVLAISGYAVGAMPPFGHRQPLTTLVDPPILAHAQVFAGGGDEDALLRLDPQLIVTVSKARLVPLQTAQAL